MNGHTDGENVENEIRAEIRNGIEELRAAETEIAFLRRDLAVKDEYIAYLKNRLDHEAPSDA